MKILVIDIGGTAVKMGLSNLDGTMNLMEEFPTESEKGGPYVIQKIIDYIEKIHVNFDTISICTTGQVDEETGSIIYANENMPNYTNTELKAIFEKKFGVVVKVENDVNAAALGERNFGVGQNYDHFLCLTYGTGVGGAMIINSKIYHGQNGVAGEYGHMILYPNGRPCNCGKKGCYEQYASTTALVNEALKLNKKYTNGKVILQYIEKDLELKHTFHQWILNISYGLVSLIHIFNPPLIILGGGIMEQENIVKMIQIEVNKQIMKSFSNVRIVGASLGNKAGMLGALSLIKD